MEATDNRANVRNFGIFAHVDAGKTTLTEQLLYRAGALRRLGRVDDGTAATDDMDIERRRGISVRAQNACLSWQGCELRLIDTPGHVDFSGEAERAMLAIDGAVLLVSAIEGVQPHAQALARALSERGVPYIVFINKADREGADIPAVVQSVARELSVTPAYLSTAFLRGEADDALNELVASHDDALLEEYVNTGALPTDAVWRGLHSPALTPVLSGSALRGEGVEALLTCVVQLLPPPSGDAQAPLCAVVFGVSEDGGAQTRVFSGTLKARDLPARQHREALKITRLSAPWIVGAPAPAVALPGDIVTAHGLRDARVGDVLGDETLLPRDIQLGVVARPLLSARVTPQDPAQEPALREALARMSREDPHLSAQWDAQTRALIIRAMGALQLEVLPGLIASRFGVQVALSPPDIVYKETPRKTAVGFYAYTMPKPCWAVLRFEIEPLPRGAGVEFVDIVSPEKIAPRYRRQVAQTIPRALRQGNFGYEVTDCRLTLTDGEDHPIHTHPLDFALCTPIAVMDALRRAGTALLEPLLDADFHVPGACAGRLIYDIGQMRGELLSAEHDGDIAHIRARLPLATSLSYPADLAAYTGGKGRMSTRFHGYAPCPENETHQVPYRGAHPLDTARYILAARNALASEMWD